jgi:hypothetical protein
MRKISVLLLMSLIPAAGILGQTLPGRFSLIQGISIVVAPALGCSSVGVQSEQIEDVARMAARAAGWRIEESSDLVIAISIDSLGTHDDRCTLRIEVRGGISADALVGDQNGIGNVFGSRTIEATRADSSRVLSVTSQLVQSVSQKLHREFVRLAYPQPPTPIDNTLELWY